MHPSCEWSFTTFKYYILFIIKSCKRFTIFAVTFLQWKLYNRIYLFHIGIYKETITSSEIIVTKIGQDNEYSEYIT